MPRYRPVTIRMAPSTWEAAKAAADEEGLTVADFVRGSVMFVLGVRHGIALSAAGDLGEVSHLVLRTLGCVEDEDAAD